MIGSIQDQATFAALRTRGLRVRQGPLTITFLAAPVVVVSADDSAASGPRVRVAYAIGTRVGNAVVRNRCRRRLRGVFSEADPSDLVAGAYLVGVHPDVTASSYEELREHVERALKRINLKGGHR